jgi:hypothetical protein
MESYIRHTHSLNLAMNDQQRLQFSKVCPPAYRNNTPKVANEKVPSHQLSIA